MIFRQLFDPESSTYSYLIGCGESRMAVLVDPVLERVEDDLAIINELGLTLAYTLETHIHADHITAASRLRSLTGCAIACPAMDNLPLAQVGVSEDKGLDIGEVHLRPLHTPGHTDSHHSYFIGDQGMPMVLTGDALLIDGCGRTDFQGGDARTLYNSVRSKIFGLPRDTLVWPGHDYNHRHVSSVAQERERNPRLGDAIMIEQFVEIMDKLNLPPSQEDRRCGSGKPA